MRLLHLFNLILEQKNPVNPDLYLQVRDYVPDFPDSGLGILYVETMSFRGVQGMKRVRVWSCREKNPGNPGIRLILTRCLEKPAPSPSRLTSLQLPQLGFGAHPQLGNPCLTLCLHLGRVLPLLLLLRLRDRVVGPIKPVQVR